VRPLLDTRQLAVVEQAVVAGSIFKMTR